MYDNRTENTTIGRLDAATRRETRVNNVGPDCRTCLFARRLHNGTVICAQDNWFGRSPETLTVYRTVNTFMKERRKMADSCGLYNDMREEPNE